MKTLYIECSMGASGDMLTGALFELLDCEEQKKFISQMNALGVSGVTVAASPAEKCGIHGTHMTVTVNGAEEHSGDDVHLHHDSRNAAGHDAPQQSADELDMREHTQEQRSGASHHHDEEHELHGGHHAHASPADIARIISSLAVPEQVRAEVRAVYQLIADAESAVHGVPVSQIHFHEVGSLDAVADITAVCLLISMIAPDHIVASPVNTGRGTIHCAHGILPVPAPATELLLRGIPTYCTEIEGELCTPTGAALLKRFVSSFGTQPVMRISKTGYGMGAKDFVQANCVRAMLGETEDGCDRIVELRCNIDDMTAEAIGFAQQQLFDDGALDVFTVPIGMKKNRPGTLLTCMCRESDRDAMIRSLFRNTTTIGIREYLCNRYVLSRSEETVQTKNGSVRFKTAAGWGTERIKPEYDDIARIARDKGISFMRAAQDAVQAHASDGSER